MLYFTPSVAPRSHQSCSVGGGLGWGPWVTPGPQREGRTQDTTTESGLGVQTLGREGQAGVGGADARGPLF